MESMKFFSSWSGGKDSSLALYRAIQGGGAPKLLLSIFEEGGVKSRAHGLKREILKLQSESLRIPFEIVEASWGAYRDAFIEFLNRASLKGMDSGVFGDIDLLAHREWLEDAAEGTGIKPVFPLWGMSREEAVTEFIESGFEAYIVSCKKDALDASFLGRRLDKELLEEFREIGVDLAGENGEYHSIVVNGPIFNHRLDISLKEITESKSHYFKEVRL